MSFAETAGRDNARADRQSWHGESGSRARSRGRWSKPPEPKSRQDWAQIWFDKLAKFHHAETIPGWRFSVQQVVAFLRSRVEAGDPASKRLRIVEGLLCYRNTVLRSDQPKLEPLREKLQERAILEKFKAEDASGIADRHFAAVDGVAHSMAFRCRQSRQTLRLSETLRLSGMGVCGKP